MKGIITIGPIKFHGEIDSDDPAVQEACQRIIDNAAENLEAIIANAVCRELERLLPGITARTTGSWEEEE